MMIVTNVKYVIKLWHKKLTISATYVMIADLKNFKNMRRLIYDMFYADEISEDVAYKLIDKLNKIRDKTKYSWERWKK